jgi:hypothetical protein
VHGLFWCTFFSIELHAHSCGGYFASRSLLCLSPVVNGIYSIVIRLDSVVVFLHFLHMNQQHGYSFMRVFFNQGFWKSIIWRARISVLPCRVQKNPKTLL